MQPQRHDPYTPPPRHTDKSGVLVRLAILGVLIAAVFAGYAYYAPRIDSQALVPVSGQDVSVMEQDGVEATGRDFAATESQAPYEDEAGGPAPAEGDDNEPL